jgi:hypothetical protein
MESHVSIQRIVHASAEILEELLDPSGRKITDARTVCVSEERSNVPQNHVRSTVAQLEKSWRLLVMHAAQSVLKTQPAVPTLKAKSTALAISGLARVTNAKFVNVPLMVSVVPPRAAQLLRSQHVKQERSSSHQLLTAATATSASATLLSVLLSCQAVQRTTLQLSPTQVNAAQSTNVSAELAPAHHDQSASTVKDANVPTTNLNAAENTSAHQLVVSTNLESSTTSTPHGSQPLTPARNVPVLETRT